MMATTSTVPAPETLWANIPPELKSTASWVCWRYGECGDNGKPKKVPVDANEGTPAKVNEPATWATFDAALAGVSRWGCIGIGFVFGPDDPFAGIDIDDANGNEDLLRAHVRVIEAFREYGYCETSVSGTGLHIIVRGRIEGARKHGVEAYSTGRFFAFTGNVLADNPITECQDLLNQLQAELAPNRKARALLSSEPQLHNDDDILRRMFAAKNGAHAERLMNGIVLNPDGSPAANVDASAVDLGLCNIIVWHTKNVEQVDRLLLRSRLGQRDKVQRRPAYRLMTIGKAFDRYEAEKAALNVVSIEPYLASVAERARQPATLPPPVGTLLVNGVAEPMPGGDGQAAGAPAAALLALLGTTLDAAGHARQPGFHASAGTGPGAAPGGFLAAVAGGDAHSAATGAGAQPQAVLIPPPVGIGTPPPAARLPVATPWTCHDPAALPPRRFLHARHYIRGVVSTTIAPGGVGKSQLAITDAIAMAAGRDLIGNQPAGELTVWYSNLEDSRDELNRRIAATLLHYGLTPNDLGERLYVDSGRETPFVIAREDRDGIKINYDVCGAIVHEMRAKGVDVLIIDPFISSHQVPENNNNAVDMVVKAWAAIASVCNCAVELVHHARKGNGNETTVDDGRGASALIGAVRSARVLNRMNDKEAPKCGIALGERAEYVRVNIVKSNLARATACPQWFRMASHVLPNGDDVGIVEGWKWPAAVAASEFDADMIAQAQAIVAGKSYRMDQRSPDWIGHAIGGCFSYDKTKSNDAHRRAVKAIIAALVAEGWLTVVELPAATRGGHTAKFVQVGKPVITINLLGVAPGSVSSSVVSDALLPD